MGTHSKKIINFVIANRYPGSAEGLVVNFANHLAGWGHNVIISYPVIDNWVYTLWFNQQKLFLEKGKLRFLKYWLRLLKTLFSNLMGIGTFFSFRGGIHASLDKAVKIKSYFMLPTNVNMSDADYLIVLQDYLLPWLIFLDRRKGKVLSGVVIDYRQVMDDQSPLGLFQLFAMNISKKIHVPRFAVSVHAQKIAQEFGIYAEKVIYNGIDSKIFQDSGRRGQQKPLNVTCLVLPGRAKKGAELGLSAMSLVRDRLDNQNNNDVVLRCFGDNLNKTQLNNRLREVFDEVHGFLKHEDFVRMLQETDIFVFPSEYEGFGFLAFEAMSCGCATVMNKVGVVEDMAESEPFCLVAEQKSSQCFADCVMRLIGDVDLRDRIKSNAVNTVLKFFTCERAAKELEYFLLNSE